MIEYRIGWSASSNASFRGLSDWEPWDDEDAMGEDVELALSKASAIPEGLEMALEYCGFEWWVETRETADVG